MNTFILAFIMFEQISFFHTFSKVSWSSVFLKMIRQRSTPCIRWKLVSAPCWPSQGTPRPRPCLIRRPRYCIRELDCSFITPLLIFIYFMMAGPVDLQKWALLAFNRCRVWYSGDHILPWLLQRSMEYHSHHSTIPCYFTFDTVWRNPCIWSSKSCR